jgi:dolichol kinase
VIGFIAGWVISDWQPGNWGDRAAAIAGVVCGLLGAVPVVIGALRRGGTRAGTVTLLIGVALVLAGLAFVPVAGYLLAIVLPLLALLLRRRRPERYAGLRTLAKD